MKAMLMSVPKVAGFGGWEVHGGVCFRIFQMSQSMPLWLRMSRIRKAMKSMGVGLLGRVLPPGAEFGQFVVFRFLALPGLLRLMLETALFQHGEEVLELVVT